MIVASMTRKLEMNTRRIKRNVKQKFLLSAKKTKKQSLLNKKQKISKIQSLKIKSHLKKLKQ